MLVEVAVHNPHTKMPEFFEGRLNGDGLLRPRSLWELIGSAWPADLSDVLLAHPYEPAVPGETEYAEILRSHHGYRYWVPVRVIWKQRCCKGQRESHAHAQEVTAKGVRRYTECVPDARLLRKEQHHTRVFQEE